MSTEKRRVTALTLFFVTFVSFFFVRSFAAGEGEGQALCGMPANLLGYPPETSYEADAFVLIRPGGNYGDCLTGNLTTLAIGFTVATFLFLLTYPLKREARRVALRLLAVALFLGFVGPASRMILDRSFVHQAWDGAIWSGIMFCALLFSLGTISQARRWYPQSRVFAATARRGLNSMNARTRIGDQRRV